MKNRLMKIQTTLVILSSATVLAASPLELANNTAAAVEEPANTECFVGVEPCIAPTPEVVIKEVTTPDAPVVDDTAVPIDWVIRSGGDNTDVMLYSMAGGGTPVLKLETSSVSKELGQNEKGGAIETREMGVVPQINREKKGPVALLKKGRVFLR